ncbi:hypothetical protein B0H16DRAFT_1710251 [Mycena metata]|uniref:Uncharacterized protein n=1 Tax=Mycena metata TaxID=1033252 RepID=A0AAD7K981_9AGAR|nr:hypothetical protein B0H16DRAFT_1710251 [Mycena metata]
MSLAGSGYFTRLTQACWSFFLSIFPSRRRRHLSLELPISSPSPALSPSHEVECDASGGLGSWQLDKQQFLRRPSLVRASMFRETRAREAQKQRNRKSSMPPPPEIYVEDWSSLGLNMTDLFETPSSAASRSGADSSTDPGPELSAVQEEEEKEVEVHSADNSSSSLESTVLQSSDIQTAPTVVPAELQDVPDLDSAAKSSANLDDEVSTDAPAVLESAILSFSVGHYPSNAMSAVSGLLWDPPAFSISHSTPLPDVATSPRRHRPQSTTFLTVRRDSLVPYPDLFDFSMYDRRVSQDSFGQAIELSPMALPEPSDKKRPVSIYDVVLERNRYRGAAYSACIPSSVRRSSSPRRQPLASTLNLGSGAVGFNAISKKAEKDDGDVAAQFLLACDELSRCEWTEEEFMTMFASSVTV